MGKGVKWTDEEVRVLKENYTIKSKDEILKMFPNRTWKAIKNKANSLELKIRNDYEEILAEELYSIIDDKTHKLCKCCRRYLPLEILYYPKDIKCKDGYRGICKECKGESFTISNAIPWNKSDVDILILNYSKMTNKELIKKYFPNRKEKQLSEKASSLGLKKDYDTLCRTKIKDLNARMKISNARKIEGAFVGSKNPMFNSKRFGELNPNWKGGITNDKEVAMRSEEYKKWRNDVFKRDNYTCQCCGKMTHNIEAHHLDNFVQYIDKRYDVDNGITLCKKCHNPNQKGSYHNEMGTLNNTKEQFYMWMKTKKELIP